MTTVAILQPGYLPWLGYFDQVAASDVFVFFDDVQYVRHTWRNRNRVLSTRPLGWQWLTVPVRAEYKAEIRDIALADTAWARKHLRTLELTYRRAPYFDFVYPALERYLGAGHWTRLIDLCIAGHAAICELLGIRTATRFSSEMGHEGSGRAARPVLLCSDLNATCFLSGDAAREYNDEALFRDAGVDVVYQNYPHPTYQQFGRGFVTHLSAIDALMFGGPTAREWARLTRDRMNVAGERDSADTHA